MGTPNQLEPAKVLNYRDKLRARLHAFFAGYIWDATDPTLIAFTEAQGITALWHPDEPTAEYYLGQFIEKATTDLLGNEWILDYPNHYFSIDASHHKIVAQRGLKTKANYLRGAWGDKRKVLIIQTNNTFSTKTSTPTEMLRLVVHEYTHSVRLGLEQYPDWETYNPLDWFHEDVLGDDGQPNWPLVHEKVSNLVLTPGLAKLGYGYIQDSMDSLNDNPAFDRASETIQSFVWNGFISKQYLEEVVARGTADVSVSNALHDDISYLFMPGIENVFSQKFIEKIKLMAWPRLPENKPALINIFKDGTLWD